MFFYFNGFFSFLFSAVFRWFCQYQIDHRQKDPCHKKRAHQNNDHRVSHHLKIGASDPAHHFKWNKNYNGAHGRADHGRQQIMNCLLHNSWRWLARMFFVRSVYLLNYYDSIIDYQTNGRRNCAKSHNVKCIAD